MNKRKTIKFLKGFGVGLSFIFGVFLFTYLLMVGSGLISVWLTPYFGLIDPLFYGTGIVGLIFSSAIGWTYVSD